MSRLACGFDARNDRVGKRVMITDRPLTPGLGTPDAIQTKQATEIPVSATHFDKADPVR